MVQVTDTSDLDFDGIKQSLKTYLENQDRFRDYDFEGSGLSTVLDLLAYNTHMNAMLVHLNMNETFLDTAQVRASVVSHAQAIGYVPRSATAASVVTQIEFQGEDISPSSMTIGRGVNFRGTINGKAFMFTPLQDYTTSKNSAGKYIFTDLEVHQGILRSERFRVDALQTRQSYELYSDKIDTSTLRVRVYETATSNVFTEHTYYDDITGVTAISPVYFLKENTFGNYEVFFGDNCIGKKPEAQNVVEISWLDTDAAEANDIRELTLLTPINDLSPTSVSLNTLTFGGEAKENIEQIRRAAPVNYSIQNRAVTASDYKELILAEFSQLKDVSVWGGEDSTPPVYGKVYLAPALYSQQPPGELLKTQITNFIRSRNIGSVTTEILDPEYTYISLEVGFKYNTKDTRMSIAEAETAVLAAVMQYNADELNVFSGLLRHSRLTAAIDNAVAGITGSIVRPSMYKKFRGNPLKSTDYVLEFPVSIYQSSSSETVSSCSNFYLDGELLTIRDEPGDEEDLRNLYIIDPLTNERKFSYGIVGTIRSSTGIVKINNIRFDDTSYIQFQVRPDTFDIVPKYKQLLLIEEGDVSVLGEEDTVSAYNIKGLTGYKPFKRHS